MIVYLISFLLLFSKPMYSLDFAKEVAEKLTGEGAVTISIQSNNEDAYNYAVCTVYNRLQGGWKQDNVLDAYYATNVRTDAYRTLQAYNILNGLIDFDCGDVYYMYSNEDLVYLGISQSKVAYSFQGNKLGLNYINKER